MVVAGTAEDMRSAQDLLASDDWDVALLDHYILDGTGLELIRWATAQGIDRPMLLLTGAGEAGIDEAVLQAGGQDFLAKSDLARGILLRAIRFAVHRHRAAGLGNELKAMSDAYQGLRHHLGVIGHELRAPLGAIRVNAEMNMMQHSGATRTAFETILQQAHQLSDIAENMLASVMVREGSSSLQWQLLEADELIASVVRMLAPLIGADVELRIASEDEAGMTLNGDRGGLLRLLINLMNNAIRHTSHGFLEVRAEREVDDEDRVWCRLLVRDSGTGIAPENLTRLGEAFAFSSSARVRWWYTTRHTMRL